MRRLLTTAIALFVLVVPLLAAQSSSGELVRETSPFWLHHDDLGDNTCGGPQYMSQTPNNADVACTGTVRVQNQVFTDDDLFPAQEGVPLTLDALGQVSGKIRVALGTGVSDFDFSYEVYGYQPGSFIPVLLASGGEHMTGFGGQTRDVTFTAEIPDQLDGTVLSGLEVRLQRTNSIAVLAGGYRFGGQSWVIIPVIVER